MKNSRYQYYVDKDNLNFRFSAYVAWERLNSFGDWVCCEVTMEQESEFMEVDDNK